MSDTLYLIDGSHMAFRAFYAIRGLTNRAGEPTNALYGFVATLLKLIRVHQPSHLAIVFDPPGGSFRNRILPEYKGHRPDMDPDLRRQWPVFREIVEALGIAYLEVPDYEADDVIGTLSDRYCDRADVMLVTGDKDFQQLIRDRVRIYDPLKDAVLGPDEVREKFGCAPEQVPDVLGLMGDSSDNIPGVPKVGLKTAKKLIEEYGTIEGVYEHLDEIKRPALHRNLAENREQAELSRTLAIIERAVPLESGFDDLALTFPPEDTAALEALFDRLDFQKLLAELGATLQGVSRDGYELVTTEAELAAMVEALRGAEVVAFDTETTSLQPMQADLVGISLCADPEVAYYVPVAHAYEGCPAQLTAAQVRAGLGSLLEDPVLPKVAQNAKYDLLVLRRAGIEVQGLASDTMVADYLLRPQHRSHKLDDLAMTYLQHEMIKFADVVADPRKDTFAGVPLEEARDYAAEDAHVTYLLHQELAPQLAQEGLDELARDVEIPLVRVLADMEAWGVGVDRGLLEAMGAELGEAIEASRGRIHELAGREFNINSPKQLAEILFDELDLPVIRKTKSGPSTDARVLDALAATASASCPARSSTTASGPSSSRPTWTCCRSW